LKSASLSGKYQKNKTNNVLGSFSYMSDEEASNSSCFSYKNLEELAAACIDFYCKSLRKDLPEVNERRKQLARWVRDFHQKCGTLTSDVEASIGNLEEGSCLVLMTAHQPNLFAYSGVLRKATLNHVLAKKLSENLRVPVVSFFGVADQDFTDDRWVMTAQLPDAERRNGLVELKFDMPQKLMLNRVGKPSKRVIDNWQNEIKNWISRQSALVERECKLNNLELDSKKAELVRNFEAFWELVQNAYDNAEIYSDFNAFVMSRIVNEVWGYDTLFSRFSECQQIFEREFSHLLAEFDNYSSYIKESLISENRLKAGVFDWEFETIPFWYHCGCGSKARLTAEYKCNSLIGRGSCLRCGKEYVIDFQSKNDPQISEIVSRISARSLSMPLIFFHGLGIACYVGGVAGKDYLMQARHVAKRLGLSFSPVVIWRPRDVYSGIGQLSALIYFKLLSGTSDFSQYESMKVEYKKKVAEISKKIQDIELQKTNIWANSEIKKEERMQTLKDLISRQNELKRATNYPVFLRNFKLLENVAFVMSLHPCIVDYAVNVGLKQTSEQWIAFLRETNDISLDINLKTGYDDVMQSIQ
jgi:hypothetical protein